jgi:DNA processing protein
LDLSYPPENARLAARIVAAGGAIVSEFPRGTAALRHNFPQRNRLISGLCKGTLVIEAARRSGSLITARLAGIQGRDVMAVPGSIHNPVSRGCHRLIRQGAVLVESTEDILQELSFSNINQQLNMNLEHPVSPSEGGSRLDKTEEILLDALGFEPAGIDELVARTGQSSQSLASKLLILELAGKVAMHSGGRYMRVS